MDMFEFLRGFFRYPNNRIPDERGPPTNHFRNPIWNNDDDETDDELHSDSRIRGDNFGFNIFSNPLEMHRYFEQQLNQIVRSFHSLSDAPFFDQMNPTFDNNQSIEDWNEPRYRTQNRSLRDEFLKPGFETADESLTRRNQHTVTDSDLDGQLYGDQLDSFLKRGAPEEPSTSNSYNLTPFQDSTNRRGIFGFSFGQSMTSKMITRPDGTVETHKTIKDSEGNEETVITIKKEQELYTKTIRKDSKGVVTETEDVVPTNQWK